MRKVKKTSPRIHGMRKKLHGTRNKIPDSGKETAGGFPGLRKAPRKHQAGARVALYSSQKGRAGGRWPPALTVIRITAGDLSISLSGEFLLRYTPVRAGLVKKQEYMPAAAEYKGVAASLTNPSQALRCGVSLHPLSHWVPVYLWAFCLLLLFCC
jgi:hypothetical protein